MKIVIYKSFFSILLFIIFSINLYLPLIANNIEIKTVTVTDIDTLSHYANLMFDISWDNSWRLDGVKAPYNWDAVWIFAKYRVRDGEWYHCKFNSKDDGHSAPTGSTIDAAYDSMGVFIYLSSNNKATESSTSSIYWEDVKLNWNYGLDCVSDDETVAVKVFAIEMVYIPQDSYCLYNGECDNIYSNFNSGNTICSEDPLPQGTITWNVESNWCGAQSNDGKTGGCDELQSGYPKGYQAIYCMKYEISQGQYADFLSNISETQSNNRYPNQNGNYQHTIKDDFYGNYYAAKPNRSCNYLSWADGLAFADWAGLRPMTELEYEKICRGQKNPENAFFSTDYNNSYANIENLNNVKMINCLYSENSNTPNLNHTLPYYGVMMMRDNLSERCITVAKYCWNCCTYNNETHAGSFDGKHGDGYLTKTGFSNVSKWPSQEAVSGYSAYGSSIRGACWMYSPSKVPVSDRNLAAYPYAGRIANAGFRLVRTAPVETKF